MTPIKIEFDSTIPDIFKPEAQRHVDKKFALIAEEIKKTSSYILCTYNNRISTFHLVTENSALEKKFIDIQNESDS